MSFADVGATGGTNTPILTNPKHTYSFVDSYAVFLEATPSKGCKVEVSLIVEIKPDFALYIPNTFTPDGNGLNDMFYQLELVLMRKITKWAFLIDGESKCLQVIAFEMDGMVL